MDSLFAESRPILEPLAVRMRPNTLDEFYGQEKIVGKGSFLRSMVEQDTIPSMLLYGPSGTGKTTLANIIAKMTHSRFIALNATNASVGDLRKIVDEAKKNILVLSRRTIVFVDEIHRFNKGQQDVLLPFVEDGTIVLIGATTENPFFEVNRPLLSRLRLITLEELNEEAIAKILKRALTNTTVGLGAKKITFDDSLLRDIGIFVNGDARIALNILEQGVSLLGMGGRLDTETIEKVLGRRIYTYDKNGDSHYDTISAFIKSMRGSDPDATMHYMARMIEAGEDPNFIARRIIICAAEDVGLADPQALVVANAAAQAAHFTGFPEARIILSEAALYVALAPKSNSAILAIDGAIQDVRHTQCGKVPAHLRDAHYGGAAVLGHGSSYKYAHDYPQGYVKQQYLPDEIRNSVYYEMRPYGEEKKLFNQWQLRKGNMPNDDDI